MADQQNPKAPQQGEGSVQAQATVKPGMVQGQKPPEPPKAEAAKGVASPSPIQHQPGEDEAKSPTEPRPTEAAAQGQAKESEESPAPVEAAAASAHPDEPAAGSETREADIPNASERIATERAESLQYTEPMSDPTRDVPPVAIAEPAPHIAPPTLDDRRGTTQPIAPPPPMDAGQQEFVEHAAQVDPNKPRIPEIPPDPDPYLVEQHLIQQRIGIDAAPVVPVPHDVAVESQAVAQMVDVDEEAMDDEMQTGWDGLMSAREGRPSAKQAYIAGYQDGMKRNASALEMADLMAAEMDWANTNALPPRVRGATVLGTYQRARK